jgi:hypothetical protein
MLLLICIYLLTNIFMRTNTNKLMAWALLASLVIVSGVSASTIGGVVLNGGTGSVIWNDSFPGLATGTTVTGINVNAKILPTLNMEISGTGTIDLGELSSVNYQTGSVNIEVGTNATAGAAVTATSTKWGLQSGSGSDYLNNLTSDGLADSYVFSSTLGTSDSAFTGMVQSGLAPTEINSTNPITLYSSNKPQATTGLDDLAFSISAKPNAQSPAGNYNDVVTLTVTGNF